VEGGADQVGSVTDLHTKGWLPYTLRWTLTITEPITDTGFALSADGDLSGTGRWTFLQQGPEVLIRYDWRIHANKPLLRHLTWLLRPVFAANHRWAMARGEESLRLELRRRRATTETQRAGVPPPPPPTFRWLLPRSLADDPHPPSPGGPSGRPGRGIPGSPVIRLVSGRMARRTAPSTTGTRLRSR
jgi:hypothetical protein